jgi:serine/threonine protein phosphatase PrpC
VNARADRADGADPADPADRDDRADPADPADGADRAEDAAGPVCPVCAAEAAASDAFCEACGASLRPPPPCPACGGVDVDGDGFCLSCGLRRGTGAAGDPSDDRVEVDLGRVAGVSDRGLVHRVNEDGMGLAFAPWPVAVVCDGVSTAPESGPAARAAAAAATEVLCGTQTAAGQTAAAQTAAAQTAAGQTAAGQTAAAQTASAQTAAGQTAAGQTAAGQTAAAPAEDADGAPDVAGVLVAAAAAAQRAMLRRPVTGDGSAPSATFAAAVVAARELTVGWLGDSRVYLLGADGPMLLTADDTLAARRARAGLIPPEAAETGPGAHTITRWLGRDNGGDATPHLSSARLTGPGRVVVCSDGLWNYASDPAVLAGHVADLPADAAAIDVARHLTDVALRAGGRDNITVVVLDIPGDPDGHVQH